MLAQKQNTVLTIPSHQIDLYYNNGYDIYEDDGTLIKKAVPTDVGSLQIAYIKFQERIKELEAEITSLKAEIGYKTVEEAKSKKSKKADKE